MIDFGILANLSTAETFEGGAVIIEEDTFEPYCMYVLLRGKVGVYKSHGAPDEVFLATLQPGDFFGEMSLFLKQPRTATVVALESTIALKITQENVLEIMKEHPEISIAIMETLCKRESETREKYPQLGLV
jgi:CRP-like cAMP-binding protein